MGTFRTRNRPSEDQLEAKVCQGSEGIFRPLSHKLLLTQSQPTQSLSHYSPDQDGMASHVFSEKSSTASDLNTDARGVGSNEMASLVQFQNTNVSLLPTSYGELAENSHEKTFF